MEITREISITPKIIISSFLLYIAHLADILPLESPFLHHLGVFLIECITILLKARKQNINAVTVVLADPNKLRLYVIIAA